MPQATKLSDEDRKLLSEAIITDLCGGQLVPYGLKARAEMVVDKCLASFEHTPEQIGPGRWQRIKSKLFGEVNPALPDAPRDEDADAADRR